MAGREHMKEHFKERRIRKERRREKKGDKRPGEKMKRKEEEKSPNVGSNLRPLTVQHTSLLSSYCLRDLIALHVPYDSIFMTLLAVLAPPNYVLVMCMWVEISLEV